MEITTVKSQLNAAASIWDNKHEYPPQKQHYTLCKKGCYTVLYNACIHVLCTRYTRVIRMCITLRMDTLYTVAYNNYSITLCITSV